MREDDRQTGQSADSDLIDSIPLVGRATTQLERSFGSSCLLSLVVVLLALIVLKLFVQLSWTTLLILAVVIWMIVLTLLVRWSPSRFDNE